MTDSHSTTSVLTRAGYEVIENADYERLRDMASDWVRLRDHMKKCDNCQDGWGDEEYDGQYVDNGVWYCAECISGLVKRRLEEEPEDVDIGHLFNEIQKVQKQ